MRRVFCETAFKLPHVLKGNFLTFLVIFGETASLFLLLFDTFCTPSTK